MVNVQLHLGDCLEIMRTMEPNSVDSIVTDPPYGLNFMGKDWDHGVPGVAFWEAALRVAKPGAHLLAFGGDRTHHRMMVAIEDAGWEIRTCLYWVFSQGFPKSLAIDKAIDKAAGAEREVVATKRNDWQKGMVSPEKQRESGYRPKWEGDAPEFLDITAPATDAAKKWQGWGTALKPAVEIIVMARKPLSEKNIAANVQAWGTGGINVDATRIPTDDNLNGGGYSNGNGKGMWTPERNGGGLQRLPGQYVQPQGRWPANLLLDESAAELLDEMSGVLRNGGRVPEAQRGGDIDNAVYSRGWKRSDNANYAGDSGGASRFFARFAHDEDDAPLRFAYIPKASKRDRDDGLEGMPEVERFGGNASEKCMKCGRQRVNVSGQCVCDEPDFSSAYTTKMRNFHPTVKPTALCRWLVRLVTPPNGTVLDCFAGSGSTGKAAMLEGFNFIGVELDEEYLEIARRRIEHAQGQAQQQAHMPFHVVEATPQLPLLDMTGD